MTTVFLLTSCTSHDVESDTVLFAGAVFATLAGAQAAAQAEWDDMDATGEWEHRGTEWAGRAEPYGEARWLIRAVQLGA